MTSGCTVVTPLLPDGQAVVSLLRDIHPGLRLYPHGSNECWRVMAPVRDAELLVIEYPRWVRVTGEMERLYGSDLGFPPEIVNSPNGLYWLDVHVGEQSDEALELLIVFCRNLSERGHGTYLEHNPGLLAFPAGTIGLGAADTPPGWDFELGAVATPGAQVDPR